MANENNVWKEKGGRTFKPDTPPGTETNAKTQLSVDLTTHVINDNLTRTHKILGQSAAAATTLTDLYAVPSATQAEVSSITVAETGGAAAVFRISFALAGAANNIKQYIAYDAPLNANESVQFEFGIVLGATDVIRVYSDTGDVVFGAFGIEIT